ncbi:MAG: GNAT family N-acetyltransferase [Actinobacteria bacterium]|nr:GNAT family N-acetyltransferase [Actinomycetota bacterium]
MNATNAPTASMHVVQEVPEAEWKNFVDRSPRGNVFHTQEMHQVFEAAAQHAPEVWAVVDDAAKVLALLTPVRVGVGGSWLQGVTARSISYGSVLCEEGDMGRRALDLLLSNYGQAVKGRTLFTELRNLDDLANVKPTIDAAGFLFEDHLNYLVDLDHPIEEIFGRIRKSTRSGIRKGLREHHVEIREVSDADDFIRWHEILVATYRNARVPLAHRSLFQAVFDILRPAGMARLTLAMVNGHPAACSLDLFFKDTIYKWYGGTDRTYGKFLPNELMTWHIFERGASEGYRLYDFGGAGKPNEPYGVRDFKAKFGGDLVNLGRYVMVHAPGRLRLAKSGYAFYRKRRT